MNDTMNQTELDFLEHRSSVSAKGRGEETPAGEWVMPEWMYKYLDHLPETTEDRVTEFMNSKDDLFSNAPRVIIATSVRSAVTTLTSLYDNGVIE